MNIMALFRINLGLCLGVALSACGSWAGNPIGDGSDPKKGNAVVELDFGTSDLFLASTIDVTGKDGSIIGAMELTEAKVALAEIELMGANHDEDESGEEKFAGPFIVDLLDGSSNPAPESITVSAKKIGDLKMKIHKLEDEDADLYPDMKKLSILIKGHFVSASGGAARNVEFSHEVGEELSLKTEGEHVPDFTLVEGANVVSVNLDLASFFKFNVEKTTRDVDFTSLSGDIDMTEASTGVAKKLRETVKGNFKRSVKSKHRKK